MNKMNGFFNLTFTETKPYAGIWLFSFLSLLSVFITDEFTAAIINVVLGFAVVVSIWMDVNQIKAKNIDAPSRWWLFLPVVYMFRRDKATNKPNRRLALVYLAMTIILTLISLTAKDLSGESADFPKTGCAVVNTMDAVKQADLSCVKISNVEKVADHWYRGEALLSNGTTHTVMGEYKGQDHAYLEVTLQ